MSEASKSAPVSYEKIVYDSLLAGTKHEGSRDTSDSLLKVAAASKEIGISQEDVLRAVAVIRQRGYPVISQSSRRMKEDGFRIPKTHADYMVWHETMVKDIKALVDLLRLMDAGSEARFNEKAPKQTFIF